MHYILLQYLLLLFAVVMLIMLAQKLKIAYPIFLVVAGLLISNIPHIPVISIDPDLIFLIFLPPLLFEAAWYTSWNDLWKWRRPIGLLSVGLVIFTSGIIAFLSVRVIPGFTLPMGFLLGAIISPPDAIAATSVLKNIKVPKNITAILEGESLINDASSLIIFRFALAAVLTGQFSFHEAISAFFIATIMGIAVGLAVAYFMYFIHRHLPTTSNIDAVFTLLAPYFMYLAAEQFHFSGVMAVVSGGLFLSYRSHEIFLNGQTRLQVVSVWSTLIVIMNGLIFIMIGLELPEIMKGMERYSLPQAIRYSMLISLVIILVRLIWIYPATFLSRWVSKRTDKAEPDLGWKGSLIIGWSGMRGVVSLAAALSLPILIRGGAFFPHRDLIIFISFVVILVTLVFQGLTLPFVIRWVKIRDTEPAEKEDQQQVDIQLRLIKAASEKLHEKYAEEINGNELLRGYKTELEHRMAYVSEHLRCTTCGVSGRQEIEQYNKVLKSIYQYQRKELFRFKREGIFNDELIRKEEKQIDLNEAKVLER